jgi:hypothetical protein
LHGFFIFIGNFACLVLRRKVQSGLVPGLRSCFG